MPFARWHRRERVASGYTGRHRVTAEHERILSGAAADFIRTGPMTLEGRLQVRRAAWRDVPAERQRAEFYASEASSARYRVGTAALDRQLAWAERDRAVGLDQDGPYWARRVAAVRAATEHRNDLASAPLRGPTS